MRYFTALAVAALLVESVASTAWIPTLRTNRRSNNSPSKGFVTMRNGQFQIDGRPFFYFGTTAYWLMQLSDENIDLTMKSIASKNITVVRTWAFNDVTEIPTVGAWFQAFHPNGTIEINTGPNGLQRLDKVISSAQENGLKVQLALSNNWNPERPTVASGLLKRDDNTTVTHVPGFLSNDYGGMDAYVRAHGLEHHDQFYSNQTIIDAFTRYLNVIVDRYKDNPAVLSWELANDARCNSTLAHSGTCQSQTVTRWHSTLSQTVKTIDPNHIVGSGTQGFYCVGCPKLFPLQPRPRPSPAPGQKRRATGVLTEKRVLAQRRAWAKRSEEATKKRFAGAAEQRSQSRGEKVKWSYRGKERELTPGKRQVTSQALGSAFDGSQGVDSEDILNIPQIGFSTFQLFPDQNIYLPLDPSLDAFNNTVQIGVEWIRQQASTAETFGKPITLNGFGLVTQDNLPAFVPFNTSQPFLPVNSSATQAQLPAPTGLGVGLEQGQLPFTEAQQETAYAAWIEAAIANGVNGITQYQWGQANLVPPTPDTTQPQTFTPSIGTQQQQVTPNDGYTAISDSLQNIIQQGAIQQQQQISNA